MIITEILLQLNLLNIVWFDSSSFTTLLVKFSLNIITTFIIVGLIYRSNHQNSEFVFTYFVFNLLIFFLCHLMLSTQVTLGFAFGLFALFSIMRYRTMPINIKEMTYLFSVVCVAVMNALNGAHASVVEQIFINVIILSSIFLLEKLLFSKKVISQRVIYEKIEMVKPENYLALKADLESRLGHPILEIEISRLNYLSDSAVLEVYFEKQSRFNYSSANSIIRNDAQVAGSEKTS